MNLKDAAKAVGFALLEKALQPGSIDFITDKTAIAINQWAGSLDVPLDELPFPFIHHGSKELGNRWSIPDNSWARIWFQRAFWLHDNQAGTKSRWINGRQAPQDIVKVKR